MEILRRAPMFPVFTALITGAVFYERLGAMGFFAVVLLVFSAICFCSYRLDFPAQWQVFIFGIILALLCAFRMYYVFSLPDEKAINLTNQTGTVLSIREWGKTYAAVIEADNGKKYAARFHFAEVTPGTRIEFNGTMQNFRTAKNSNDFDEAKYWKARGVTSWIRITNFQELPKQLNFASMRHNISRKLSIYTPELTSQYLKAAWLGERNKELDADHIKFGTSHLLAVSGFHIAVIMLCAKFFFRRNFVLLSIILWLYIILTGAAPSALRAGLMIQLGLFSRILERPVNSINCVSAAGVILLAYSPFYFWDIGFRLSILSVFTIIILPYKKFKLLFISPYIFIITLHQVIYTFKDVPLTGIILNIFAPLYFAFAFTIASVIAILKLIHVPFMGYALLAAEGIFILWEKIAYYISELVKQNYFYALFGSVILIFLICRYFHISKLRTIFITIAGSFIVFAMFM